MEKTKEFLETFGKRYRDFNKKKCNSECDKCKQIEACKLIGQLWLELTKAVREDEKILRGDKK